MQVEIILDQENEEFVLETEWDIAVPVDFILEKDLLRVTCFPQAEAAVQRWLQRHEDAPFSIESLRFLWRQIAPLARAWGYCAQRHRERWGYIYRCDRVTLSPQENTRLLTAQDEDWNLTSYDLEMTVEDGRIAYGSIAEGKVVSVAVSHAAPQKGAKVELGVESCVSHRKKGYAASNLAAATEHLLQMGCIPEYRCYYDNIGSQSTAKKAGYYEAGKYYYYVLRKKREADKVEKGE